MKNLLIIFLFVFSSSDFFPQTDWEKWEKKEIDYRIKDNFKKSDYDFDSDNGGDFILKSFVNSYRFFISDVDGDNCPFRPSCSIFFVDAVKETNIFQGSLMFFDRFTRDMNVFKKNKYPRFLSGYYFDPAFNYTLSKEQIQYKPANEIVTSE